MKYFRKPKSLERHLAKLQSRQPPGAIHQFMDISSCVMGCGHGAVAGTSIRMLRRIHVIPLVHNLCLLPCRQEDLPLAHDGRGECDRLRCVAAGRGVRGRRQRPQGLLPGEGCSPLLSAQ